MTRLCHLCGADVEIDPIHLTCDEETGRAVCTLTRYEVICEICALADQEAGEIAEGTTAA